MNRIHIILLLLFGLFFACRDNYDITTNTQLGPIPTVNVQSTITGRVTDTIGNPISGALVEVAGQGLTTDERGLFFVHQKLMNKNGTYVKVSQNGYFNAGRFAFPELNKSSFIEIKMIPRELTATFQAGTGKTFSIPGVSVNIPANAIAGANGQLYSGTVNAYAVSLGPNDPQTFSLMPGDLRGEDANGYAKVLSTFGMFAVELESPSGEKLNLFPGKTAAINVFVPDNLFSYAPEIIPIWHFNETNGYWKQEGEAPRSGSDHYSLEVPHFSFWNCDVPNDYVMINGHLSDAAGHALIDVHVSLSHQTFGTGDGYTNSEGNFGGAVPPNVPLNLQVTNACGDILLEQEVGPFNQNTDIGNIIVHNLETITVTGTLLDCISNPLAGGLAIIAKSDTVFATVIADENGHFSATFNDCVSFHDILVQGYDLISLQQSPQTIVTPIDGVAEAGNIQVCDNLDQYFSFTINGYTQTFVNNIHFEYGVMNNGYVGGGLDSLYFTVGFENLSGVQASIQTANGAINQLGTLHNYGCSYCDICACGDLDAGLLQFTELPTAPGEYAAGTLAGMIRPEGGGTPVPYSVNFRIKLE